MKKKFLQVIALFAVATMLLAGCGEKQSSQESSKEEKEATTQQTDISKSQPQETADHKSDSDESQNDERNPKAPETELNRQYCEGIWEFDYVYSAGRLTDDELKEEGLDYNITLSMYPDKRFDMKYESRSNGNSGTLSGTWDGDVSISFVDDNGNSLGEEIGFAVFDGEKIMFYKDYYRLSIFFKFAGELPDEYYPEYPDGILGPWRLYKCISGENTIEGFQVLAGFDYLIQMDVKEDGTFSKTTDEEPQSGIWKKNGDSYTFDWGTGPLPGKFENGNLIIGKDDQLFYFNRTGEVQPR